MEELASLAAGAFGRIRAVKIRYVVVPDIAEPSVDTCEWEGFLNEKKGM